MNSSMKKSGFAALSATCFIAASILFIAGCVTPQEQSGRHNNAGYDYYTAQMYPQAMEEFEKALELDPRNAEAHNNIGNVYMKQKKFTDAAVEYQKAIELEVQRQTEAWEDGVYNKEIFQETRLYDSVKNETRSMRGKEGAADYRYFPEPDIPPVTLDDEMLKKYSIIPELPDQKRERYVKDFGISAYDAGVLTAEPELAEFFENLIAHKATPKMAVSWMSVELLGRLNKAGLSIETSPVSSLKLAELIVRIEDNTISGKAGKDVLEYLMENSVSVDTAIEKLGLKQISDDSAIEAIIDKIMTANPAQVEGYRSGKEALLGFFVGQVMKASQGKANPGIVNKLLKQKLNP